MSERTFTLEEAQALLPVLGALLERAMEGKKKKDEIEAEMQRVAARVFAMGGMRLDVVALVRRKSEGQRAAQQVRDALAEITAAGVQVKDLGLGLLDFPCRVGDRVILLCWKAGEKRIAHWHTTDEGFAGRKPIQDGVINPEEDQKPN